MVLTIISSNNTRTIIWFVKINTNYLLSYSEPESENVHKNLQRGAFPNEDPFRVVKEGSSGVATTKTVVNTNNSAVLPQPKGALQANEEESVDHYSNDPFRYNRV